MAELQHEAGYADLDADFRESYIFNSKISGIDEADAIVLIGTNPRVEGPVLNARIRAQAMYGVPVAMVGASVDLTYPYDHLGETSDALDAMIKASSPWLKTLKEASRPMIIVGSGVLRRPDRDVVMSKIHKLVEKSGAMNKPDGWTGFNILHDTASRVAALDIGFVPNARAQASKETPKLVYLLGSDDYSDEDVPSDAFVIYQGHHGDKGAARADIVLPGAAYTEKFGMYVNTEGRCQSTKNAVAPVAQARDDWKIIRALSEICGCTLPVNSLNDIRARLVEVAPHLDARGDIEAPINYMSTGEYVKLLTERAKKSKSDKTPLATSVSQFYQTDAISRASKTMARCVKSKQNFAQ